MPTRLVTGNVQMSEIESAIIEYPPFIAFGKGYQITDEMTAELKRLYGDNVQVKISEFVPEGKVITYGVNLDPHPADAILARLDALMRGALK